MKSARSLSVLTVLTALLLTAVPSSVATATTKPVSASVPAPESIKERTLKAWVTQYLKAIGRSAEAMAASEGAKVNDTYIDASANEVYSEAPIAFDPKTNTASLSYGGVTCSGSISVSGSRTKVGRVSCSNKSRLAWESQKEAIDVECKDALKSLASLYRDARSMLNNSRAGKEEFRNLKEIYSRDVMKVKDACKDRIKDLGPRPRG